MIKVYFPPGCYGTYVARCIYNYTNLRVGPFVEFEFDSSGSSHWHRDEYNISKVIDLDHWGNMEAVDTDQIVVVLPCQNHKLDYFNNQFFKYKLGQTIDFILSIISEHELISKLNKQWEYTDNFDNKIPQWIMREWISFWIHDVLNSWADPTKYNELNAVAKFSTQDIFEDWPDMLIKVVSKLGLTLNVNKDMIQKQHKKFLTLQKLHNSQNRCHQYVNELLAGNDINMTMYSIFDEAYIQHLLRQHNIEIQCDGLINFPTTTQQLKNLTYETSNNSNQG